MVVVRKDALADSSYSNLNLLGIFISNGQGDPLRKRGEELPGLAPYTFALHGYS
jgi:hypothetical protein